jgi:hypothetical protein
MAAATGMSQMTISRIWRAFGLEPHVARTWELPADPEFIGKVRGIVGLFLDLPDKAQVLAVGVRMIEAKAIRAGVMSAKASTSGPISATVTQCHSINSSRIFAQRTIARATCCT